MINIGKNLLIKISAICILTLVAGGFLLYKITLNKVDQKYKTLQTSNGQNLSTTDTSKDFVALKLDSNPQSGGISLTGDISGKNIQGSTLTSTVQNGAAPINVTSSTLINNLNADMVDGKHAEELVKTTTNVTQQTVNNITNTTGGETIASGTTSQYYRGDKSWQTLNKSAVGLSNVENTALSTWAGSANLTTLGTIAGNLVATGTVNGATLSGGTMSGGNIQGGTLTASAVNGVSTADILIGTGSYANPAWLTSLAGSKISGNITGSSAGLTGTPNIIVGTIASGNITSTGTLNITGTGNSSVGGNIAITPNDGSDLVTNGSFTGSAGSWTLGSGYTYSSNLVSHSSNGTDPLYQDVSDTAGESYGAEKVTDGNFSVDPFTNGWSTFGGGGWAWNGSHNAIAYTPDSNKYLWQDLGSLDAGSMYRVQFKITGLSAGNKLAVSVGCCTTWVNVETNGFHTVYVPKGWGTYMGFYASGSGSMTLDDVSVKKVTGASHGEDYTKSYKLTFTVSGMSAGTFTPALGETLGSPISTNGTYTQYLNARPNASIVSFIPSNDARFTIDNVSLTEVQNGTITVQDIITKGARTDVRAFGAKGDGKTDDSAAIQMAQDSLPDQGGVLYFPPGTYLGHVILKSNIHVEGSGVNSTILKLPDGANTDVITSKDFASLDLTTDTQGVNRVTIENITIDGNKDNNTSGYGIRKFGSMWYVHDVVIKNCKQDGVYTDGGSYAGNPPGFDSMEDKWSNILITANEGNGVTFKGPHDSLYDNFIISANTGNGIEITNLLMLSHSHIWGNASTGKQIWNKGLLYISDTDVEGSNGVGGVGIYVDSTAAGMRASNVRVYTNETGIYLGQSQCSITGGYIRNNSVGIKIMSDSNNISGVDIYDNTTYGIQIGDAGKSVNANSITGITTARNATHIAWLNASGFNNTISAALQVGVTETTLTGTPPDANSLDLRAEGAGTLQQTFSIRDIIKASYTAAGGIKVGIGDTSPDTALKVVGSICAKSDSNDCAGSTAGTIYASAFVDDGVQLTVPDYVFEEGYNLMPIADLKNYVQTNKHLPNIQGMAEIKEHGLNYGQMIMGLLEKTEENTLYTIDNSDQLNANNQSIVNLQTQTQANTDAISQIQNTLRSLSNQTVTIPDNLKVKTAEIEGTLIVTGDATFSGTLTVEGKVIFNGTVESKQGVQFNTQGEKPVCDETKRGTLWVTQGGAGIEDITEMCIKDTSDDYIWKKLY